MHVPTHVGMRTNCTRVNRWPALYQKLSVKGSSMFGLLHLPMLFISHHFRDFEAQF